MGWREREWAHFTDEEKRFLYGASSASTGPPVVDPSTGPERARWIVWTVLGLVAVVVVGLAVKAMPDAHAQVATGPSVSRVVFGHVLDAPRLGGAARVCTDYELAAGAWRCNDIAVLDSADRPREARTFQGPCAHLVADQTTGIWTCTQVYPSLPAATS